MADLNTSRHETGRADVPPWMRGTAPTDTRRHASAGAQTAKAEGASPQRLDSLDGLRALAIAAIIAYHLRLSWLPSGHMGVVIFLVLTGYLAATSLMRALSGRGTASLPAIGRFWARRLRRLWPSLAATVIIVTAVCALANHVLLTKLRPNFLPDLTFAANIADILRGVSYFDQIGGPSPLTHLWYLGVSEQFCLVLPALCLVAHRLGTRRGQAVALVLAVASALLMAALYVPHADPTRVYYGPDTRAFAPLLGVWLALGFPPGHSAHDTDGVIDRLADPLGLASLVALAGVMVLVPDTSPLLYRGGMAFVAVLSVLLVMALTHDGPLARLFSARPLVWLGRRSYSIYLWHYPIIVLFGAGREGTPGWLSAVAVATSLIVSIVAYHMVEHPRPPQGATRRRMPRPRRASDGEHARTPAPTVGARMVTGLLTLAVAVIGLAVVPDTTLVPTDAIKVTGESAGTARSLSDGASSPEADGADAGSPEADGDDVATVEDTKLEPVNLDETTTVSAPATDVATGRYAPVIIGDSVPAAEDANWMVTFPNALVDTYVGRHPFQANDVLRGYLDQGVVGSVVVMATYSNSTPTIDNLNEAIAAVGKDRQIFLVGTVNPEGSQDETNANITAVANASDDDNVRYIDWPSACAGHESEYLWGDATHLRPEGAAAYVDTVRRAITQAMVDAGGTAA